MDETVEWARDLAEGLLADALPRRWAHTQGVARQARSFAHRLGENAGLVEAAAWLHDIGYAPAIALTGFHPLDGARYLRDTQGADDTLCELVAHHTGAVVEAEERGMTRELAEFGLPQRHSGLLDALTAADVSTSPDGAEVFPEARIGEILNRYEPGDVVHRAVTRSGQGLINTTIRVTRQWAAARV
jgi:putative nucleotidyltransferase with HDIG domain